MTPLPSIPDTPDTPHEPPAVGELAYDSRRDRVGTVMDTRLGMIQLRPPGGGCEWDARREDVHAAGRQGELRARVAQLNADSASEVL